MSLHSKKFVCIHGHFYQPPRENPWTGLVERQSSAGEDHDWNARIARECYIPNGRARMSDSGREVLHEVNNYSSLSFNFGPTLLSWLEKAFPEAYQKILEADRESAKRLEGHGNAIAQAYNHAILPLCNEEDRLTQVLWGLADFEHHFGRKAEALWLPETACDDEVLRLLIDCGMKYAILSPFQAQRARHADGPWEDVSSGGIDARHPYRWFDPADRGRHIDIFFYHGALSQGVAFEKLMADAAHCAKKVAEVFDPHPHADQLVTLCTDGETYGHHEKFAEMGLAHLFKRELSAHGLTAVNFGYFLAAHHPRWEAEIKKGPQRLGTAWSCSHGLGRWMEDCGCGAQPGQAQKWRAPLRESLDWLGDRLAGLYQAEAEVIFQDPWQARNDYIEVLLEKSSFEDFLKPRLKGLFSFSNERKRRARLLLEMQRQALLMYTSCGWFFSDIAGLEAVQNLKYAHRAMELARELSRENCDWEPEFLERLKEAPSNDPELKNGAEVYRRLVVPAASAGMGMERISPRR
ncbi:MAG: DUF3536 domain-containing protein [Elusimicrobia bacterium]|nr:DUF3536 domain-containing protein [Elusimicrobiota bacterium]